MKTDLVVKKQGRFVSNNNRTTTVNNRVKCSQVRTRTWEPSSYSVKKEPDKAWNTEIIVPYISFLITDLPILSWLLDLQEPHRPYSTMSAALLPDVAISSISNRHLQDQPLGKLSDEVLFPLMNSATFDINFLRVGSCPDLSNSIRQMTSP